MAALHITKDNFDSEVLHSDKPVLVDFWAPWCNPCRMLAPVLEELANDKPDVKVCKVNIDEEQALAERFGVMSIPTVVCLLDGVEKSCKINVDEQPELAAQFDVMTIPTLIVIKDGKIMSRSSGVIPKQEILDRLNV